MSRVALEYDWYGDAYVDTEGLRAFIATVTGGDRHPDGTVFLGGMYVMAEAESDDDINPVMALFGFDERFTATFRFANLATESARAHNTALMAHVLIAFAQTRGGNGVLLHNGDRAVRRYGKGGIVFGAEGEDWRGHGEVAPLLNQFASRVLPQPLL